MTKLEAMLEKIAASGPEQYRRHEPAGGSNCIDPGTGSCGYQDDWFCPACERWMCWCRGGGDDDGLIGRVCDTCWYRVLQDEQHRVLAILRARTMALAGELAGVRQRRHVMRRAVRRRWRPWCCGCSARRNF